MLTAAALLLVAAWQPRIARTAATVRYRSDAQGTCTLNNFTKSPARARPALLEHFTESKSHVGLPCHVRAQCSAWHGSLDMAFLFALRLADLIGKAIKPLTFAYGHITLKAPVLVRSPKLSNVEPG